MCCRDSNKGGSQPPEQGVVKPGCCLKILVGKGQVHFLLICTERRLRVVSVAAPFKSRGQMRCAKVLVDVVCGRTARRLAVCLLICLLAPARTFHRAIADESCTQIVFTSIGYDQASGAIDINLCIPDGVTNIDLFSICDLIPSRDSCSMLFSNCPVTSNRLMLSLVDGAASSVAFSSGDSSRDTDEDGLPDAREHFLYRTKMNDPDTDHDGLSDGWEWRNGLDFLDPEGINGGEGDSDGDSLNNLAEQMMGTSPRQNNVVVDLAPEDVVRECRAVSVFNHKAGFTELTNASSPARYYLRADENYLTETTYILSTPPRKKVGSNFADVDPCDGSRWGVTHEIKTWANDDDLSNVYCTDYQFIETNSHSIKGWIHYEGSQVYQTSTSYRWNIRYDYPYSGMHLDCSGLHSGDCWSTIDYELTLSSEFTTPILESCAAANMSRCGGLGSVPWNASRIIDMGQCRATNLVECRAVRNLSADEYSIAMSQLEYRYRFTSQPGVIYRLTWLHWFTPEGLQDEELHDSGVVMVHGVGGTQYVESPDFLIAPPAKDGVISPDMISMDLVPDWNRDRAITSADENQISPANPFRMWINDDRDSGDISEGDRDIPGQGGLFSTANCDDAKVNGRCDLVDFFPLWLDLRDVLTNLPPSSSVEYRISQADGALRAVYTDLTREEAGSFLTTDGNSYGPSFNQGSHEADTFKITSSGVPLSVAFLEKIAADRTRGILMLEGVASTKSPLVLEVMVNGVKVGRKELPLSVDGVEKMYRHVNLRPDGDGHPTATGEPSNNPDVHASNEKNVFFLHGFNVNGEAARGWNAEMFKRLYKAGFNARFWGVTWEGDLGLVNALHYQENVANCFRVASNLYAAVNGIPGKTFMAHSLGNMVVSAAIEDYGLNVDSYYMLNAAVAIEAYDLAEFSTTVAGNHMVHGDWSDYKSDTWSATWHQLFPPSDDRAGLTWKNRFSSVLNYAYNYYSSGDEIFELYPGTPGAFSGGLFHLEQYAWQKQEIFKGCFGLGSTDEAGWGFSGAYTLEEANAATPENLRTNTVFRQEPAEMFSSNIVSQTRNEILGLGIPALSGALGRNHIKLPGWIKDYNMDSNKGAGWPRSGFYADRWLHSDLKDVAYPYTYTLFDRFVLEGGLE